MPSIEHETILDDVRFALVNHLRDKYPELDGENGFALAFEAPLSYALGLPQDAPVRADMYVYPGDGYGLIPVEVGRMSTSRWEWLYCPADDRPVRVLRVTFERACALLHPRGTQFERDMLECLAAQVTYAP